jgi:transcriptional regulator with XRE-family HTH domain
MRKAPKRQPPSARARHYIEQQRQVQELLLPRLRREVAPRRLGLPTVSLEVAAELARVTPAHLRAFESGGTLLNPEKRARLMAAYGIDLREWLRFELKAAKDVANRPYEQRTIDFSAVAEAREVARRRRRGGGEKKRG